MSIVAPGIDIASLKTSFDAKCFSITIVALVVYDLVLTSGDTISLFWMHDRWSAYKVLFFINEIAVLITLTAINALIFVTFDGIDGGYHCIVASWVQFIGTLFIISIVAFTLASRVYALWKGHYIVLTIFFLVMSANLCNFTFMYGIALYRGTPAVATLPFTGCLVIIKCSYLWVTFANTLLFEALSIGLIIYKAWPIARQRGIETPLFSLLLEDGIAYYLTFTISKLFTVGALYVPTPISMVVIPSYFAVLIAAMSINRLFIHLQEIMVNKPTITDFTTGEISKYGYEVGTGSSTSGGGSSGPREVTTIGGTGPNGRIRARRHRPEDEIFTGGEIELHSALSHRISGQIQSPTAESIAATIDSGPRHVV